MHHELAGNIGCSMSESKKGLMIWCHIGRRREAECDQNRRPQQQPAAATTARTSHLLTQPSYHQYKSGLLTLLATILPHYLWPCVDNQQTYDHLCYANQLWWNKYPAAPSHWRAATYWYIRIEQHKVVILDCYCSLVSCCQTRIEWLGWTWTLSGWVTIGLSPPSTKLLVWGRQALIH